MSMSKEFNIPSPSIFIERQQKQKSIEQDIIKIINDAFVDALANENITTITIYFPNEIGYNKLSDICEILNEYGYDVSIELSQSKKDKHKIECIPKNN
jgi:hypothetical protein